ncbi:MFS transporter [Actinomadura rubrobrunea]|uniref:MFS transporter n=1 Tax=Actinomadura rubrobrunea TaxID=115335 RepID=A0A9W6PWF1_9ACTN|nr:MFS transporter [Actinomadura rubrobrunea]GLW65175.1 MFS transporter [Actinomadura rubrobrunea]
MSERKIGGELIALERSVDVGGPVPRSAGSRTVRRDGTASAAPSGWLVALLAVACGMTVANLYYAQPLLSSLSGVFGISTAAVGGLITVTQIGYVAGMLLVVPLGDRVDKRRLVVVLLTVTMAALVAAGTAGAFTVLLAASAVVGVTSVVAQILVPFAAGLAPAHLRGRVVGRVMSGLLTGILLSRALSSVVSEAFGWRVVYLGSAVLMAVLALALHAVLPSQPRTTNVSYGRLLGSCARLVRTHPALMRYGLYQASMFGVFSAFWTTVSFVLTGPGYHYSGFGVGVFALVGVAGAAVAPLAGRWADHGRTRPVIAAAFLTGAGAFALAGFGRHHIVLLALAAILLDMAAQTTLILGQHCIYRLDEGARARLNSVFIATFFVGGAIGSQVASVVYHAHGWTGVTVFGAAVPLLALLYWVTEHRSAARRGATVRGVR